MSKRLAKEAFVQGHTGTNMLEIICISIVPAVLLFITTILSRNNTNKIPRNTFYLEFSILVLPHVLQLMGPTAPSTLLIITMILASLIASFNARWISWDLSKINIVLMRQALSAHRASTMIITCIAILAVDFHAFPRRFAKAETFGTGLMDAGVGSIVVASAFASGMKAVAAVSFLDKKHSGDAAVTFSEGSRSSSNGSGGITSLALHSGATWTRNVTRLIALLSLGIARSLATSATDYQQHVGEYGVYWNFFITLGMLRIFAMVIPQAVIASPTLSGAFGVLLLLIHQISLSFTKLTEYIHADRRGPSTLSLNKEGVFSLLGYFALHLLGCACGGLLEETTSPKNQKKKQYSTLTKLVAMLWTIFCFFDLAVQPVSRRACNAAYITWMLALNVQSLVLLACVEAAQPTKSIPSLLYSLNDTMLATFLIANVLTGILNLSIDTMKVNHMMARCCVGMYMLVVCYAACVVKRWQVRGFPLLSSGKRKRL